MVAAAARGAETIAQRAGATVVQKRRASADADQRWHLKGSPGTDVVGLVVGEVRARVAARAPRLRTVEDRTAALGGSAVDGDRGRSGNSIEPGTERGDLLRVRMRAAHARLEHFVNQLGEVGD